MKFNTLLKINKQCIILVLLCIGINGYGQINFEEGYFINNGGEKINCLIKNVDWKNNPTQFDYKVDKNSEVQNTDIHSVKEFSIVNQSKYQRFQVKIDRSSENLNNLSTNRNPEFNDEVLFLKVLIEGKANLYSYDDHQIKRFFYAVNDYINAEQLIFKSYEKAQNKVATNNGFRQQLSTNLVCKELPDNIKNINYRKPELIRFFENYNRCNNSEYINYNKKRKNKNVFNVNIRPGMNISKLSVDNIITPSRDIDFDNEFSFRLGIELEYILPFNKGKWTFFVEPTYQNYKSTTQLESQNAEVDYKSIELPFGVRHYLFINNASSIFINGAYVFDFNLTSEIDYTQTLSDLDIESNGNFILGLGYNYKRKYSLETRYGFNRELLDRNITSGSKYNNLSIIFGFTIL